MNSALYTRVSTLEQAQEGYSLEAQAEKLINYSNYQKYTVIDKYVDDGYSASSMSRPALQRLIKDIKSRKIDIVIIYKLDRLSRKVKDVLELVDLFQEYNVTLYSLTENLDLSSPFGRAALKMSATFSELERENIIERTTMGKNQRAKSGYMMPTRFSPFGYNYNKETKFFDINEEEAEIVKKIFELYIEGYSFRKLYEYCKLHYDNDYFTNSMCCKPIIRRSMYAGFYIYNGEFIKGKNFESIILMETYLKAQQCLKEHTVKRTNNNSPYLLTGLIYCAKCGNRYIGKLRKHYVEQNGKKYLKYEYRSYGCSARLKRDAKYTPAVCDNIIFDAKELDDKIITYIKNLEFTGYANGKVFPNLIEQLIIENSQLEEKKQKLLDLYMESLIDKQTYKLRVSELEKSVDKNNKLIQTEKNKIEELPTVTVDYLKKKITEFDTYDINEKRKILGLLIDKIIVNNDNIIIKMKVK